MSRVRADPITAALAHPTRRNLYTSLFDVEEMSTVQLQKLVDVDRYNLYHHLKKLASLDLIENHRDEGRARWWKISRRVEIPGVVNASNIAVSPSPANPQILGDDNVHTVNLEGSRDRVGAKLLLEKLAEELGIELDLPWNFVPESISIVGKK